MRALSRRWFFCFVAACFIFALYKLSEVTRWHPRISKLGIKPGEPLIRSNTSSTGVVAPDDQRFRWDRVRQRHPVTSMTPLPSGRPPNIPRIQHNVGKKREEPEVRKLRKTRRQAVKDSFVHTWKGYKTHAWLKDEVAPVSGGYRNSFGGWAATLVDTLDTLWIMGLRNEFDEAVTEVTKIDFSTSEEPVLNVFETTIRYLGGFLSAYDLSGYPTLLDKAIELGEMLYVAFDTPNRMPITRWDWKSAVQGKPQEALENVLVAEIGSLSLEFTRLSQLSKDPKYFDAIQRITEQFDLQQNHTKLPGMWPVVVNAKDLSFTGDNTFTLGAMADSLYEYLPKQYMMLGGLKQQYRKLYEDSIDVAKKHVLYTPLNQGSRDILLPGNVRVMEGEVKLDPQGQHLACFAGGMIGIAAKIFERDDLEIARKLVDGCVWAYETMPTGIMPETFHTVPCLTDCQWDDTKWHQGILYRQNDPHGSALNYITDKRLQPGFTDIGDRRPEAIESLFILYRITGNITLQDKAWNMFQAIEKHTRTEIANAAIDDVTTTVPPPPKSDRMESFWTAETLKYFYLIFSEPDLISLDDFVFNTEAHPLKRPEQRGFWN
ncbi:MAG: hypothetical protein M1830_005374 [Pleopsidium flavum]|nr:MAG: hypothetical protein M1830_005374 [Pleopsidium flavum]